MYRGFWYAQALDLDNDLAPALQDSIQADVCIVGGGFLGLWSAIRLKQAHPEKNHRHRRARPLRLGCQRAQRWRGHQLVGQVPVGAQHLR